MLAADCANVGLFSKAICCSSSRVIVFCSEAGACALPGKVTRNKAQEKQSTNRAMQRSDDTVSTLTFINFTGIVSLFMFALHPRHVHFHWLVAFLLSSKLHDLVVLVLRQNPNEPHHSPHETPPPSPTADFFRFFHHFV